MGNQLLRAAINYVEILGIPVFPVHGVSGGRCDCGKPEECRSPGKHPHTARGMLDASTDRAQIEEWWRQWPNANVAMPTGAPSLYFVLDIDMPHGEESLAALIEKHGGLPGAPTALTGGGGRQIFFGYPMEPEIRNSASKLGLNLDIRGNGGYVVLPPSVHITGRRYRWEPTGRIERVGMVEAPEWLLNLCTAPDAPDKPSTFVSEEAIPEGSRNDRLYRLSRSLRAKRLSQASVLAAVLAENRAKCNPALPDKEVEAIVENAFKQPHRVDFAAEAAATEKAILNAGDAMAHAREWCKRYAERPDGRVLHRWDGKFWLWDGGRYEMVSDEDMRAPLWQFLRDEAILIGEKEKRLSPNSRTVSDALDALKARVNLPAPKIRPPCWIAPEPGDLETDQIVAVKNGLLHLSTCELSAATPRWFDFSAIQAPFDDKAGCPEWINFIAGLWDDQQSRDTLQEIFGYVLTKDNRQQKAFMIIGPPRSGKGTIGRVLAALLGKDAVARPALADFGYQFGLEPLIGKSLAIVSDARLDSNIAGGMLAERLLAISGEDSINVSRKWGSTWNGDLSVRFLVLANESPRLRDSSGALPARFIILKTTQSFLGKEDPMLYQRLNAELPGILNWAIEGWMRLQERGYFLQPESAADVVDELRRIANPLSAFIEEACQTGPEHETTMRDLHQRYVEWCKASESHPLPVTVFGRDLRAAIPGLQFWRPHGQHRRVKGVCPVWPGAAITEARSF